MVNACVRTLHTLSQPRRASIAAEHDDPTILEVASLEDSVQNRDGRPASDPMRRGNSSAPQIRQLFQAADGGDLVGHHLVALNSWDASTVQPKRFLRRRPSLPTTRMRRWLCWGSSATHRPWHTPEAGTVQMLSVFVFGRACVVSKGASVSSKVWELSLSRCSRINPPPVTPNSGKPESDVRSVKTTCVATLVAVVLFHRLRIPEG